MKRRDFLMQTSALLASGVIPNASARSRLDQLFKEDKLKVALVGTGIRGISMWGKNLLSNFGDYVEFVGLCDINPGRLEFGREYIGATCPTFTDFEEMMKSTKPETLIVTTVDSTHHEFIIRGMELGADIITEKPLTTDETKCQAILDAEKKTSKKVIVTFNARYTPNRKKVKELLMNKRVGDITSVDFHWYLNVHHGASYFRRWHRLKEKGGTLLVHKATHHYDLVNWWLDSEPEEVFAYGDLQFYGKNNSFRHTHCRPCPHKSKCDFHWDITESDLYMKLYAANEKHDGYLRDGCVWKEDINIYDKMAVQVKYANGIQMSYSLTTYSPFEGYRIAFNGTKGRIEAWEGIPWLKDKPLEQSQLYEKEMNLDQGTESMNFDQLSIMDNFGEYEIVNIPQQSGGHGGGDERLKEGIFGDSDQPDPLKLMAGTRDGAMSILIGIAARKSIETGKPIKVADLTSLKPQAKRP